MNKKNLVIELAMPVFFIIISIATIIVSSSMGSEGVFPRMVAVILLLSSLYIAAMTLKTKEIVVKLEGVNLLKVAETFIALILYVFLMNKIGYIISTFILGTFIIRSLGYKNIVKTLLTVGISVAVIFIIFKVLLMVPLPTVLFDI